VGPFAQHRVALNALFLSVGMDADCVTDGPNGDVHVFGVLDSYEGVTMELDWDDFAQ
jgi:hypothetical protein